MAESISDFKRKYQERMGEATGVTTADLNESMGNPMTEEVQSPIPKPSPAVIAQLTRGTKFTKDFKEVPKTSEDIFGYNKADLKKAIVAHEVGPYLKSIDSPYFFTGVSKKKNSSSGFGPGQITSTTVEDLLARYPSRFDDEFEQYALNFISQGKNKLNIDYYNSLYKDGKKIRTTKKDKEIFGGLGVGNIPREQHDKHYDKLFDLVIEDKLKQSDSIDSFLKNYHGSTKQSENQKYIKNVMGYLDNPNSIQEEIRKQTEGNEGKFKQAFDFIMSYLPLNEGGMAQAKQMNMFDEGGLLDEGGTVDQESGNEVPSGSLRKEVRDDIPAMLSEGEFVFPADVVRFIGLEKLMALRQEAKAGLKRMEEMGQMGNSEDATLPDDIPFTIDDLDLEEEEPMMRRMREGGDIVNMPQGYDIAEFEGQQTAGVQPGAGALVGKSSGRTQFSGVKTYRGPDGTTVNIPGSMVDGKFVPLYPIPKGYELVGDYVAPVEEEPVQAGMTVSTTQPSEDRERAIQVAQEEEEMRDRSYDGYVQSIIQNAPEDFDGTFESLLANRDKATFGETGIRMPQFLFNEDGILEAFNRLKSDVPTPTSRPSSEVRAAAEIDPRLDDYEDASTMEGIVSGVSDGMATTPVDPRGKVTVEALPPLVGTDSGVSEIDADEKGPKPRPKGRFISTAFSPGTGEIEIERDPNTNEFFFLDENRNRKGSSLSPANKLKFGLLDTQVTKQIKNPDLELNRFGFPKPGQGFKKPFVRSEPDYRQTFDGANNLIRGGFFFEPDETQDTTDDPGMEEFTELQRPSVKQTQQALDDASKMGGTSSMAMQQAASLQASEDRKADAMAASARAKGEAATIAAEKAKVAEAKAAADKAAAERQAIEAQAEVARQQREQSEKDQRQAERVSNVMSGVSGAEAGSVVRTREPGGTVRAKEGGKSAKEAAQQVVKEQKEEKEDKSDDKIVCTAMNNQYGFGSFRQTIWLNQSKTLDKHYQIGYHILFKPLVRYAYKDNNTSNKIIRKWLEGVARRRTADIWMQKKGKRHWAGAVERAILEPLCYIVGKLNGRTN